MYSNILIPVVFDEGQDTKASYLAAKTLANDNANFTVIHVRDNIPSFVAAEIPNEVLEASRREIEKSLADSAKALPGATAKLIYGHAGRTILDFADAANIDCIVIASHRPGIENYFLGSTASRVVRHANCAVHVIR
ncbi:MAG: universal stress protein F [Candidatus Azotimanducaceae bacterium]